MRGIDRKTRSRLRRFGHSNKQKRSISNILEFGMADSLSQVRVRVVDDDAPIRTAITATLKAEGAEVVAVATASGALEACRRNAFDSVILDQRIGDQTGLELLPVLLAEAPWMKVVVVTAFASFELAVQAIQRGACNFLPKPFTA